MTHALDHDLIAFRPTLPVPPALHALPTPLAIERWLTVRMAQLLPLPADRVRLVGVVVLDPEMRDPDDAARASWIADGDTIRQLLFEHATELGRFDAIAAVTWLCDRPVVAVVIVNP